MPALHEALPAALQQFIQRGGTFLQTDDDDWEVEVETPPGYLAKSLPTRAVLIAGNGLGDHLFLVPVPERPETLSPQLHVFWHEGAKMELFEQALSDLTDPPPPTPSKVPPVLYADGVTPVLLGDEVIDKFLFFKRRGRVTYVPGISRKHRELEHGGLTYVAITIRNGRFIGRFVDPETSRLQRNVILVERSDRTDDAITPETKFL
jgi:hypothetical protein